MNPVRNAEKDNQEIHGMLRRYNRRFMKEFRDYSYHIEEEGRLIAGIVAQSTFDTLEVEFLIVDDAYRGRGLGTELLSLAEAQARADGLRRVLVNTYSFQAPRFYEKLGYRKLFEISPCFAAYAQFYFVKELC